MTNSEKYKSAKKRSLAFDKFCRGQCRKCPASIHKNGDDIGCEFVWLELEAVEAE